MEYELYHFGIKGMKWGVRRYQNEDGTLTAAGKKRMYREHFDLESSEKKVKDRYVADANKWVREDMERTKKVAEEGSSLSNRLKQVVDKSARNTKQERLNLDDISDQELRNRINREMLERQYNDVFNPPTVSRGKEYAGKILEVTGDVLGIAGSAVALALAVRQITNAG